MGQGVELKGTPKGMMPLELFVRIWTKSLAQYRGEVALYNWGEPFLNPDLPAMVRHVKRNSSARLILNSNFSFRHDDRIRDILDCLDGDTIIISCDGFSQQTCERYRVGVDFDLVMRNVELMNDNRKPQTRLLWQYLIFPWSRQEEKDAEAFCRAKQIGFYSSPGGISPAYPMLPTPQVAKQEQIALPVLSRLSLDQFRRRNLSLLRYYGPPQYCLGNAAQESIEEVFTRGKGKEMLDYLAYWSAGSDGLFCKHCVERNAALLESWK